MNQKHFEIRDFTVILYIRLLLYKMENMGILGQHFCLELLRGKLDMSDKRRSG